MDNQKGSCFSEKIEIKEKRTVHSFEKIRIPTKLSFFRLGGSTSACK